MKRTDSEKSDISKLKGMPGKMREWMNKHKISPRLMVILLGIASTIWFLVRVIPKPSRATYPCMKAAAPFMSGLVIYLLSVTGLTYLSRKAGFKIFNVRYFSTLYLFFIVVVAMAVAPASVTLPEYQDKPVKMGPDDGPNQPMGAGVGINPGRVVWAWDPRATNENCVNVFDQYKPENTNQGVVNRMVVDGVKNLAGKTNLYEAWDNIFRSFNKKKGKPEKGYSAGEKIFIKVNQGTANAKLRNVTLDNGFEIPARMTDSEDAKRGYAGACETSPNVVLELLRELVNVMGIEQKNISVGDPISHIFGYNYVAWSTEFPDVLYLDRATEKSGRTLVTPTKNELIFYSDKSQNDKLYDFVENADYMINVANLKPHGRAGITLTAKNHFGTQGRPSAFHLHYSLISPVSLGNPTNNGYKKYRALVDIMGSKYLGQNTLLFVVDGLYGGGSNETRGPVKYFMSPFNNDWSNSIFMSQDQVALESVCYDFLRNEWNGTYLHSAANNSYEALPNVNGVDDYLHQAADHTTWPAGITYDPDNSGKPIPGLGVHEHWNNPVKKQYSGNLGKAGGIQLISIPDSLIDGSASIQLTATTITQEKEVLVPAAAAPVAAEKKSIDGFSFISKSFGEGFSAKNFHSVTIDNNNIKWFVTDAGIVSYNGKAWINNNKNRKVSSQNLKDVVYDFSTYGHELWIATPQGATVATIPVDARTGATTYYTENSKILSDNVVALAVGKDAMRWFGTDKGVSGFRNRKWLTPAYERKYPSDMFKDFPITAMATSPDGDSLYVATDGAGVARMFRDKVDAISGASEYAQWGPIEIPSDKVYSICITPDGTQWFGTDQGAAKHTGYITMENWTVYNTDKGLIDNMVQAIGVDKKGNVWFGTKSGISLFDGTTWKSITQKDGLLSNNIQCITVDKNGLVWFGTDNGVMSYNNGEFISYK